MQTFDIIIAPGGVRLIDQVANYIYFMFGSAGGGDTTIEIVPVAGGQTIILKPGQAYEFDVEETANRWSIKNLKGEGTIIGQVLFSAGKFTDNRVSGAVEVIDGGKNRTMANVAFLGAVVTPGQAGNAATAQLWMPVGAVKAASVEKIFISSSAAGQVRLLATNIIGVNAGGSPGSKLIGGANGTCLQFADSIVGAGVPPGSIRQLAALTVASNQQYVLDFEEPVVIRAGYGLSVQHTLGAADINVTFEFFEENV